MPCSVPVALIIFNRPDLTERVLAAVRSAQPRRLFVIGDAPRDADDAPKCEAARKLVETAVDWPCEVQTHYARKNLGCGRRPATGLDWVFSQVEEAIVLEDDCLPGASFFWFCEQLLAHYRHDARVMHISGNCFLPALSAAAYSYRFSKYTHNWGWATWRRAWQHYDFSIRSWPQFRSAGGLQALCPDPIEAGFWERRLDPIYRGEREDAWDYQWNFAVWTQGGLSILPRVNLVTNLGFREDSTHTGARDTRANLPLGEIREMAHPPFFVVDREADACTFDQVLGGQRRRRRRTWGYQLTKPLRVIRHLRSR